MPFAPTEKDGKVPGEHEPAPEEEEEEEDHLPLGVYLNWVKNELDNEQACLELPFTIILLLSFSALAYLHLKQSSVFAVDGAVTFDVEENANFAWSHNFGHKTIHDVNSIGDYWSWLRIGFLPLVVQHSWGYSESLQDGYAAAVGPAVNASFEYDSANLPGSWQLDDLGTNSLPIRDDYLHYNRIVGGIRMRQERSEIGWDYCRLPSGNIPEAVWKEWLGKPCVPADPAYELTPEVTAAETFADPKRVEWFLTKIDTLNQMQRQMVDMEDGCSGLDLKRPNSTECLCKTCNEEADRMGPWVDEQTQRIELAWVQFNWEYGLYSLVTVNLFFNRGGRIYKLIHVQSAWASQFTGSWSDLVVMISCDIIWLLSLCYIMVGEVKEVIHVVQTTKDRWYRALLQDYLQFWNTVDWISIAAAILMVVCWVRLFIVTLVVNDSFEGIAAVNMAVIDRDDYTDMVEDFMGDVEIMTSFERMYRISFTIYPMAVMLRLFKSFDAQPRLAVVTRTLVKGVKDMVHFFIVFFSCYFCMAVNAVLLFGQDVENFSTPDRAAMTLFRMLFGDWDYNQMKVVGLLNCAIFFWAFILVLFLILLNILLAILMEAYADVKSHASNQLTLFTQISELVRRYRQTQRKARVRLNEIWKAFYRQIGDEKDMVVGMAGPGFAEGTGGREILTPSRLVDRVHKLMRLNMPLHQAKRNLQNAREDKEQRENTREFSTNEVYAHLARFEEMVKDVRECVRDIHTTLKAHDQENMDDVAFQATIPDDPFKKAVEKRQDVAGAVRNVVGQLSVEVASTLTRECASFEQRQKELQSIQEGMLICAKDAFGTLVRLRAKTDRVVQVLQQQALHIQREQVEGVDGAAGIAAVLTSCGTQAATTWPTCGAPSKALREARREDT